MRSDHDTADDALFAALRGMWRESDPMPADLVDRMLAAVAMEDLSREYELLTLVSDSEAAAVRGEGGTATLQFSDGTTSVLLHVSTGASGRHRVDGWVDGSVIAVRMVHTDPATSDEATADPGSRGRFVFDDVTPGVACLRLVARESGGGLREFRTPQFEV